MNILIDINYIKRKIYKNKSFNPYNFHVFNKIVQINWWVSELDKKCIYEYIYSNLNNNSSVKLTKQNTKELVNKVFVKYTKKLNWLTIIGNNDIPSDDDSFIIFQYKKALKQLGEESLLLTKNKYSKIHQAISPKNLKTKLKELNQSIKFIDLQAQQNKIRTSLEKNLYNIILNNNFILGKEVDELENKLAEYVGTKYCITTSSGTDSLLIALLSLNISNGDEVITTPYTWISPAEMISFLGAKPVFVDIDPQTFNIDEKLIEKAITKKTKAIMPVSIYGQCPNIEAINRIAKKHSLPVIEDGAQSFGSKYKNKFSCSLTTIGSTSFFPSKPLGCYGDGGALFTNDDELALKFKTLRNHGQSSNHKHLSIGLNARFDTLQAGVILAKLPILNYECKKRDKLATNYNNLIKNKDSLGIITPFIEKHNKSVYAQYTILLDNRDQIHQRLKEFNIPSVAYYKTPLHLQPCFSLLNYKKGDFPITEEISQKNLSLPFHAYLNNNQQEYIINKLSEAIQK